MVEIQEESNLCGEFLNWLQNKYAMFELRKPREEVHYLGSGDYINAEEVLAEFFGIDLVQAEKGKRMLLRQIRDNNKNE